MIESDRGQSKIETRNRPGVCSFLRGSQLTPSLPAARRRFLGSTALILCAGASLLGAPARAQNVLPTGGKVVSGSAAIGAPGGSGLSINQTSARAILDWGSFSIGQANSVTFNQPNAASAILNRVTGATTSNIAGQLSANGQVYLVNPNGIAIAKTGSVKVGGGFVASTLDTSNRDFNAGDLNYAGAGASAAVSNAGSITTAPGGFVALVGGSASNSGAINVPLGKVGLASGERATLDLTGDGFLQVAAPTNATTANGQALVDVSGRIKAAGGRVQLKAATVAAAIRDAVNVSGVASASSARMSGGMLVLGGGPGGDVVATGRLSAASRRGAGGAIAASGANVSLNGAKASVRSKTARGGAVAVAANNAVTLASTEIDASGAKGGGTIRIGGAQAKSVAMDALSTITADATTRGRGGAVTIRSIGTTAVHGLISAQGGPQGGDGGRIETSGRMVDFIGLSVDASAASGKPGAWLLDPTDLIIDSAAATAIQNILNTGPGGTNVSLETSATGTPTGPAGTTGNTNAAGQGDIIDNAPIAWSTGATLTLSAYHSIAVNAPITISGAGGLVLATDNNIGGTSSGGAFIIAPAGSVSFTGAEGGGQSLTINGTPYTLVYTMAELDAIDGVSAATGAAVAPYGPGLAGAYALATNLVATTTYTSALIASGDSSGSGPATPFSGALEGLGHTISNLTINAPGTTNYIGLIGESVGAVRDIGLVGGAVSGGNQVGDLVGDNDAGGVIARAYATGAVSGQNAVGGLAGENWNLIAHAYAAGAVTGAGDVVGGLVGYNDATIVRAHATGAVAAAGFNVGGLVGESDPDGAIAKAYATGAVSGFDEVGGLVGENFGAIGIAYATGAVSGSGDDAGGLAGYNAGAIAQVYATGAVNAAAGFAGGLVGYNNATITRAYATGAVSAGFGNIGGLVGYNAATVSGSYFDMLTTGLASDGFSGTAVGLTTAQLQGTGTPAGFSLGTAFSGGAAGGQSGLYPYLTAFFPNGAQAISGFAYADRGATPLVSPSGFIASAPAPGMVSGLVNGVGLGSATTGANGYYYLMVPAGTIAAPSQILVTESGPANGATVTGATLQENAAANPTLANLNIYGAYLKLQADPSETSLAATISALNAAAGNGGQPASAAATALLAGLTKLEVDTTAPFAFDTPLANVPLGGALNTLVANAGGAVAQTQPFTTSNLLLLGSSGFNFTNPANHVATLAAAAPGGAIALTSQGTLTIGDVEGVSGVGAAGGMVTLNAGAIAQGPSDAYLAANTLIANVSSGIGAAALPLQTLVANLALANAANGIYVVNTGDAILAAANGGDIRVATTGNLTVKTVGALTGVVASGSGAVLLQASGDLTVDAAATSGASGNALALVSGGAFADNAGSGALSAPNGRWLVYSQNPAQDNRGGLAFAFKQYDTAFNGAFGNIQGSGDGFVYTLAPVVSLTGLVKTYDGTTTAALAPGNYTLTGAVDGDAVTLSGSGAFATKNVGTGIGVSMPNLAIASATDGGALVYGYQVAAPAGNAIGTITPATLTYTANPTRHVYGSDHSGLTGVITGFVGADDQADATTGVMSFASAATALSGVGAYAILGSGLSAENYVFVNAASNATALTIDPKRLTASLEGTVSKIYDGGTAAALTESNVRLSGFVADQSATVRQASGAYARADVGTGIRVSAMLASDNFAARPGTLLSNYLLPVSASGDVGTIDPAVLTYVADRATRFFGAPNPIFTGVVTGFVDGQTLTTATNGALVFTSSATTNALPGVYSVDGHGLIAINGNYVFAQAASNAAALLIAAPFSSGNNASKVAQVAQGDVDETPAPSPLAPVVCVPPALARALEKTGRVVLVGTSASCDRGD